MSQSSPWKPNVLRKVKKIRKGKKPTKKRVTEKIPSEPLFVDCITLFMKETCFLYDRYELIFSYLHY